MELKNRALRAGIGFCLAGMVNGIAVAGGSAVETPRAPNVVPADVVAKVRETAYKVDPASMVPIYAPRQAKTVPGVTKISGLTYGSDARQRVNVFKPTQAPAKPVPVVMFVHGGAFVRGDIDSPDGFLYDNVGNFFARNGYVEVNVEYRLAPKHPWPTGGEDLAAAIRWARKNITAYGGDPDRIVLFGQSAGAIHVAHYTFDRRLQPKDGKDGVIGSILLSGLYTADMSPPGKLYYGTHPTPDMDSINHINDGRKIPVFIVFSQYDPPPFQMAAKSLFSALCDRDGVCPPIKQVLQHGHISEIDHLDTADDSIGSDLLTFIRSLDK